MTDDPRGAVDEAHRRIIDVIQPVLEKLNYGFGLAGGNALRVHGLSSRPTRDVNYFTARGGSLTRAVPEVEAALHAAGFQAERDKRGGVTRDHDEYIAQWVVTVDRRRIVLNLRVDETFPLPVVITGLGPVHEAEAVLGAKVIAMIIRADARDFADVFEAMQHGWTPEQLISLAWQLNSDDYDAEDFTQVLANLHQLGDVDFTRNGLSQQQVDELRRTFEDAWPSRQG